ncbi:MAG: alpha/beta hydrolase [Oscillospiraceae bacterium]|nr:alpha/beta hydrolase [Oscillospiraceae bacterium]
MNEAMNELMKEIAEARHSFRASDGAEISYIDVGEGIPFLWIHGWGGNAEGLYLFLKALSQFGFRGLCYDQRGCGESTGADKLGVPQSARDAKELLEHLGIEDAVMLGYSMGAAVLLSYVEQFGSRHISRFIIGDMSPKPLNDDEWKLGLYQGWYTKAQMERDLYNMEHDYEAFAAFFTEQTIFQHTPDEVRTFAEGPEMTAELYRKAGEAGKTELVRHFLSMDGEASHINRRYWESCDSYDYRPAVEKIDVPTGLFFANPGSLYSPKIAEWMAGHIKESYTYILEDCTHLASGEKPGEFMADIVDFVKKTEAKA